MAEAKIDVWVCVDCIAQYRESPVLCENCRGIDFCPCVICEVCSQPYPVGESCYYLDEHPEFERLADRPAHEKTELKPDAEQLDLF